MASSSEFDRALCSLQGHGPALLRVHCNHVAIRPNYMRACRFVLNEPSELLTTSKICVCTGGRCRSGSQHCHGFQAMAPRLCHMILPSNVADPTACGMEEHALNKARLCAAGVRDAVFSIYAKNTASSVFASSCHLMLQVPWREGHRRAHGGACLQQGTAVCSGRKGGSFLNSRQRNCFLTTLLPSTAADTMG